MKLRFVLVRPRNPLNIGAAARAMANFGFEELVVVKPYAPVWRETTSAVNAERVVQNARAVSSIDEAIADCHLVVGTTAVRDRRLERPVVSLPELGDSLRREDPSPFREHGGGTFQAALLFGPEKTGLTTPYLERCHFWLTIPTSPGTPSMNLGQAVAVCAYEWAKVLGTLASPKRSAPAPLATGQDQRRLVRHALSAFDRVGYLTFLPPAHRERKLKRLFQRWRLRQLDLQILHGFLRFLEKSHGGGAPRE
jgi:tRNA/rRNA methyltransferase